MSIDHILHKTLSKWNVVEEVLGIYVALRSKVTSVHPQSALSHTVAIVNKQIMCVCVLDCIFATLLLL